MDQTKIQLLCDQIIEKGLIGIVFLVPLVFNPYLNDVFSLPKTCLYICFILISGTAWLIKTIENNTLFNKNSIISLLKKPLNIAVLLYFASIIISTLLSTNSYISFHGMYMFYFDGFICIASYIFLYFLVINNIQINKIDKIISFLIISGGLVALYGILQHFEIDFVKWFSSTKERVSSSLGNPNFLGAYLIMVIPLTLSKIAKTMKIKYVILLILLVACLVLTYSRAAWLGFAISTIIWFILIKKDTLFKNKRFLTFFATGIILSALIILFAIPKGNFYMQYFSPVKKRAISIVDIEEADIASRLIGWKTTLKMIKDYPLLGMGQDTFGINFRRYMPGSYETFSRRNVNAGYAHNDFLQIAATRGIIGLAVYIFFLSVLLKTIISVKKTHTTPSLSSDTKLLISGLSASCLALLIQNQFSFSILTTSAFFWLFVGFISIIKKDITPHTVLQENLKSSPSQFAKSDLKFKLQNFIYSKNTKHTIYAAFAVINIILISSMINIYRADRYFKSGMFFAAKRNYNQSISKYQKAIKLNPYQAVYHQNFGKAYQDKSLFCQNNNEKETFLNKSIAEYKNYIQFIPQDSLGYNGIGVTYSYLGKINKKFYDPAIANFKRAISLDPNFIEPYTNLGAAYYLNDNQQLAISYLEKSLDINPYVAYTYFNLGVLYALEGNKEKATGYWQEALEIDPNYIDAKIQLAKLKEDVKTTLGRK